MDKRNSSDGLVSTGGGRDEQDDEVVALLRQRDGGKRNVFGDGLDLECPVRRGQRGGKVVHRQVEGFAPGFLRCQHDLAEVGGDTLGEEPHGGAAGAEGGGVGDEDEKQGEKQSGHG